MMLPRHIQIFLIIDYFNYNIITWKGKVMNNLHKKIEIKAYDYFIKRGMTHGQDMEDWLRAEKEVLKENPGSDNIEQKGKKSKKKSSINKTSGM